VKRCTRCLRWKLFYHVTRSRYMLPIWLCRHPADVFSLFRCFLTSPKLQTLLHWWFYDADQAGNWFWWHASSACVPIEKSQGGQIRESSPIQIHANYTLRNSVTGVHKCDNTPSCWKICPSDTTCTV
jgi:hypothetical protein